MKKAILVAGVFVFAIASAFTTNSQNNRLLSPFGSNPYSSPAGQCQSGSIINDDASKPCAVQTESLVCKIRFSNGLGQFTDVDAYEGSGNCGVSTQLITRQP